MLVRFLLTFDKTIHILQVGWILKIVKDAIWITKILSFGSKAVAVNSFFSINSTHLIVEKTLVIVYNLYLSLQSLKLTSILLKVRKNILKVIFILILANKKVFSKKQDF